MLQVIREAITDSKGKISSKRITLYVLLMAFIATIVVNLCNNKNVLNPTIEMHLYLLLSTAIGAIFAERWINKKGDSSVAAGNNNAGS